jgi:integrase/recombinase XerD
MRAREIAAVTWAMVTDADGQVGDTIALENRASKGTSGRLIPVHPLLGFVRDSCSCYFDHEHAHVINRIMLY